MAKRKPSRNAERRPPGDGRPAAPDVPTRAAGQAGPRLYGTHAVLAALANPRRRAERLLITAEAERRLGPRVAEALAGRRDRPVLERIGRQDLAALLPEGAVHQGIALRATPLAQPSLAELLTGLPAGPAALIALDHITDPQNVGAILRSATAFGAQGVITTRHHGAPESGALAKAASGAFELLPYVQVGNLARTLKTLKEAGFWILGLDFAGGRALAEGAPGARLVLVLGAEGQGLRRLSREACDLLLRLPTRPPIDQLNVSNAAAVALYELLARNSL